MITVTMQANWAASTDQDVAVHSLDEPRQLGTSQSVRFDLAEDRMTVTARTVDVPPGSWLAARLAAPDQTWHDAALEHPTETWHEAAERIS